MKLYGILTVATLCIGCAATGYAQYPGQLPELEKVDMSISPAALAFDYDEVKLLDGPFKNAMNADLKWLDDADVNRFLHAFRVNCGIASYAQSLGGWESLDCEVRGHTTGHMLSALALAYSATGNESYREKGAALVDGLAECQKMLDEGGYLSAYPQYFIDRVIKQENVWAPWYTLHKVYAGMYDQYTLCDNTKALEVLLKMCDWACDKLEPLNHAEMQGMLANEFGGMPEVLFNVYGITGNERYR